MTNRREGSETSPWLRLKHVAIAIALLGIGIQNGHSDEATPTFPEIGGQYSYTLAEGSAIPSMNPGIRELLVQKWLGGTWYQVAYPGFRGEVSETNLNISQLLTLTEVEKDNWWISNKLTERPVVAPIDPEPRKEAATLEGTWEYAFSDAADQDWTVVTAYHGDGTFSTVAINQSSLRYSLKGKRAKNAPIHARIEVSGTWLATGRHLTTTILKADDKKLVGTLTSVTISELTDTSLSYVSNDGKVFTEKRVEEK